MGQFEPPKSAPLSRKKYSSSILRHSFRKRREEEEAGDFTYVSFRNGRAEVDARRSVEKLIDDTVSSTGKR